MSAEKTVTVKVSSRNQIAMPRVARERLGIKAGDRLLVEVQDGMLILLPQPEDYAARLAGLHREIWEGIDTDTYLKGERDAWGD
jgi:AbrB family looped-hinge helix DNA binding protein